MTPGTDTSTTEASVTLTSNTNGASVVTLKLNGQSINVSVGNGGATPSTKAQNATELAQKLQEKIDDNSALKGQFKVSLKGEDVTVEAIKDGAYGGDKGTITVDKGSTNIKADGTIVAAGTGDVAKKGTTTVSTEASVELELPEDPDDIKDLVGKGITLGNTQIEFYDASKGAYNGNAVGVDISKAGDAEQLADAIIAQAGDKIEGANIKKGVNIGANNANGLIVSSKEKGANSTVNVEDGAKNEGFEATFQVGANSNQTISISIGDMRADALGVKNVDLTTAKGSQEATATIQAAIEKVSTERAGLGAVQNRLEYTISNLDNTTENLTSAESTLRDVDMAKEMMTFSKNNILNQAAQAMLAQANQQPQNVLSLLR